MWVQRLKLHAGVQLSARRKKTALGIAPSPQNSARLEPQPEPQPQPQPVPEPVPEADAGPRPNAAIDPLIGSHIDGRYEVLDVLGSGGTGILYRVNHSALGKELALKVLRPAFAASEETITRFHQEARTAAAASHRNLVEVYDLGKLPDGRPYLVMPLLVGRDLSQDVGQCTPPARVAELLLGPAMGLDALHDKGLVHRDIKPSNLMVCAHDDGSEVTKVLDFGLATLAHTSGKRLTQDGIACGTPAYIAPEAALGQIPDARGDVYSLAVVALQLITGKRPFEGGAAQMLHAKVTKNAPTVATLTGQDVPADVERLFAKALARDLETRTRRCSEFVEELARLAPSWNFVPPTGVPATEADTASMGSAVQQGDVSSTALPYGGAWPKGKFLALALLAGLVALAAWMASRHAGSTEPGVTVTTSETGTLPSHGEIAPADVVEETPRAANAQEVAAAAPSPDMRPSRASSHAHSQNQPTESTTQPPAMVPLETTLPDLRVDPNVERAEGLTRDANAALVHGFVPRAFDLYRLATEAQPRYAPAWRGLGVAAGRLHRTNDARRTFERYLALQPDAADADVIRRRLASASP